MPRISVIVPAYNVEAYIPRCLQSLQAQTFGDWEAVVVDDGSSDRTPEILDGFAAKDARIRIIHQPNAGVSAARNRALEAIRGEYCLIIDGDDFLHPQLMEICLHFAERDGSDLVAFTYDRAYRKKIKRLHDRNRPEPETVSFKTYRLGDIRSRKAEDIYDWVSECSVAGMLRQKGRWTVKHCQVWRCLYRSEIIRDVSFPEIGIYEDVVWWGEVLTRVRSATVLNLPLYYYYPNRSSVTLSSALERWAACLREAIRLSETFYRDHASPRQQELWEREFLSKFRQKLRKMESRI